MYISKIVWYFIYAKLSVSRFWEINRRFCKSLFPSASRRCLLFRTEFEYIKHFLLLLYGIWTTCSGSRFSQVPKTFWGWKRHLQTCHPLVLIGWSRQNKSKNLSVFKIPRDLCRPKSSGFDERVPGASFSKVPQLSGPFSGVTNFPLSNLRNGGEVCSQTPQSFYFL